MSVETRVILGIGIYGYVCFWTGLVLAWWWQRGGS